MTKIKYRKKHEYSHFCFCLGLRPGVIISSILWMIEGIFFSTVFIRSSRKTYKGTYEGEEITSIYYSIQILSVILSLYFVILSFINAIGLASLIVYKSMLLLRMYSYTSWFYTVFIYSVLAIVTDVGMITSRNEFINYCKNVRNHVSDDNYCNNKVNSQLIWLTIILLFQGSIHIYFSIILRAYVKRRMHMMKKQKKQKSSSKKERQTIVSLENENSSDSSSPNVFKIKVGKKFDAREQIISEPN